MSISLDDLNYGALSSDDSDDGEGDTPDGFGSQQYRAMISHREAARNRMIQNEKENKNLPNPISLRHQATKLISGDTEAIEKFKENIDMIDATYSMARELKSKKLAQHIDKTVGMSKEILALMRQNHSQLSGIFAAYHAMQDTATLQKREMGKYIQETDRKIAHMERDPNEPR